MRSPPARLPPESFDHALEERRPHVELDLLRYAQAVVQQLREPVAAARPRLDLELEQLVRSMRGTRSGRPRDARQRHESKRPRGGGSPPAPARPRARASAPRTRRSRAVARRRRAASGTWRTRSARHGPGPPSPVWASSSAEKARALDPDAVAPVEVADPAPSPATGRPRGRPPSGTGGGASSSQEPSSSSRYSGRGAPHVAPEVSDTPTGQRAAVVRRRVSVGRRTASLHTRAGARVSRW